MHPNIALTRTFLLCESGRSEAYASVRLRFGMGLRKSGDECASVSLLVLNGVIVGGEGRWKERSGQPMEAVTGCVGVIGVLATIYLFYILLRGGDER